MSLFVFDTDVLSLLMKARLPAPALAKMRALPARRVATTAITIGELHFGALRSAATKKWLVAIERVTQTLRCLDFDREAALRYAEVRAALERRGEPLADADLRIAAICLALDLTLVSGNARHFGRVPGLRYENWLDQEPGR